MKPNLKLKRETAEIERENITSRCGSDARSSVGKHASGWLRPESGEPQMQRAASSQQAASPAAGKGGRKAALHAWQNGRPGTARRRSGHGTARWKGKAARPGPTA